MLFIQNIIYSLKNNFNKKLFLKKMQNNKQLTDFQYFKLCYQKKFDMYKNNKGYPLTINIKRTSYSY